jgi:transcriptional regulator
MLVHPFDSAMSEQEWRDWIAAGSRFGTLAVSGVDGAAPVMVPTHFTLIGDEILMHLHRANSALALLANSSRVSFSVIGDYAFIPNYWRAKEPAKSGEAIATSYYAAVDFTCEPSVVEANEGLLEILKAHMQDFQPEGGYDEISAEHPVYGSLMNAIRGVRLKIVGVDAKFKYDDHKSVEFRQAMVARLIERNQGQDQGAAAQQQRRLDLLGLWTAENC